MRYPFSHIKAYVYLKHVIFNNFDDFSELLVKFMIWLFRSIDKKFEAKELADFCAYLVYVSYFELVYTVAYGMEYKVKIKAEKKKITTQRKRIDKMINNLCDELKTYSKTKKNTEWEDNLKDELIRYKDELIEDEYKDGLFNITDSKCNFIYSQKIMTITGIRDLLARLLCVSIQINYYDEYMNNKYKFTQFIHHIIDMLTLDPVMGVLNTNDLYKLIKDIDIKNPNQIYAGTFPRMYKEYFFDGEFGESEPLIKRWNNNKLSYSKLYDFIDEQVQKYKNFVCKW